jgi:hypothetical protein
LLHPDIPAAAALLWLTMPCNVGAAKIRFMVRLQRTKQYVIDKNN